MNGTSYSPPSSVSLPVPIEILRKLSDRLDAEERLSDFIRLGWRNADPSRFVGGWHIDAICEHLEAVSCGAIRRLIINIPPRHMKSLAVAVHWPAWDWIAHPERRWLFASYAQVLSVRDSVKCRRVIESPWYKENWGDRYALTGDVNTKLRFENDKGGYRIATSVDGSLTGEGGDIIVIDDPHNVREVESETVRESVLAWWDEAMSSRLNDAKTGAYVLVMQRVHEADLTGHILARDQGWDHLCLPAEYELPKTSTRKDGHPYPIRSSLGWEDRRSKPGELLWPERFGPEELDSLKTSMGSHTSAGQLQQRPSLKGGAILKREWWLRWGYGEAPSWLTNDQHRAWRDQEPPDCDGILLSIDTAFEDDQEADYSAVTTWGLWKDQRGYEHTIMLGAWRDRVTFPELVNKVRDLIKFHDPDMILIERKAAGIPLQQELRRQNVPVVGYTPDRDKVARAHAVSAMLEAGKVWAPMMRWADDVIDECSAFPKGANDDYVDTVTQALQRLRKGDIVVHESEIPDEKWLDHQKRERQERRLYG